MEQDERFSLINDSLAVKMSILSNNSWKLFALFLQKIVRKSIKISKTREPTKKSNPFKLTYQDFKKYGIPSTSFDTAVLELSQKGFIKVTGKYSDKMCRLLIWA